MFVLHFGSGSARSRTKTRSLPHLWSMRSASLYRDTARGYSPGQENFIVEPRWRNWSEKDGNGSDTLFSAHLGNKEKDVGIGGSVAPIITIGTHSFWQGVKESWSLLLFKYDYASLHKCLSTCPFFLL